MNRRWGLLDTRVWLVLAIVGLGFAAPTRSLAQSGAVGRGQAIAERDCGMCHAVDTDDQSPNPDAPALRTLGLSFSADTLSQLLSTGMLMGHPRMPDFRLSDSEYGDLVQYLNHLQAGQAGKAAPATPPRP